MYQSLSVDVRGNAMNTLVFEPAGAGPHPGLVIAQHLPVAHAGLEKDPFTIDVGERYAAEGYVCVIPFIFHWWPTEDSMESKREAFRDDWTVADLDAAFQLLAAKNNVDENRIGILGHCWGGRVAWLGACHNSKYKACTLFYGGRIKLSFVDGAPPPIELANRIPCPVLGIFGNDDQNPTPEDVNDYEKSLKDAGISYEFHRYDGAGHGFQDHTNQEKYCQTQSDDAWVKAIDFLAKNLK
ncbi:MAG: dienelactone hydrolase family protein [SAR324 cluster bacterium]|nr:dienelactone hydrolase family protein [SAR324 cluster bacterium]